MSGSLNEESVNVTEMKIGQEINTIKVIETEKHIELPVFEFVEVKVPKFIDYEVPNPVFVDKEIEIKKVSFKPVMIDKPEFKKVEILVPEIRKEDITNLIFALVQKAVEDAVKHLIENTSIKVAGETDLGLKVE